MHNRGSSCKTRRAQLVLTLTAWQELPTDVPSFATGAAVSSLARRLLFPHDSGSIPGRAVSTFLSEFFIRSGEVTRYALLRSNHCCYCACELLICSLCRAPLHVNLS